MFQIVLAQEVSKTRLRCDVDIATLFIVFRQTILSDFERYKMTPTEGPRGHATLGLIINVR